MYTCPACEEPQRTVLKRCPKCGADLSSLAILHEFPSLLYNEALELNAAGRQAEALERLIAASAMAPDDTEIGLALGKMYALRKDLESARRTWLHVLDIEPDHNLAKRLLEATEKVAQTPAVGTFNKEQQHRKPGAKRKKRH